MTARAICFLLGLAAGLFAAAAFIALVLAWASGSGAEHRLRHWEETKEHDIGS